MGGGWWVGKERNELECCCGRDVVRFGTLPDFFPSFFLSCDVVSAGAMRLEPPADVSGQGPGRQITEVPRRLRML